MKWDRPRVRYALCKLDNIDCSSIVRYTESGRKFKSPQPDSVVAFRFQGVIWGSTPG